MKKLIAMILTVIMLFGMCTTAFAEEVPETKEKNITVDYKNEQPVPNTVFKIDVTWGNMEFEYSNGTKKVWDPGSHTFTETSGGTVGWSCKDANDNIIKVTNHSNTAIRVMLSYESEAQYSAITGSFDKNTFSVASAVGSDSGAAPTGEASLTLTGALSDTAAAKAQLGKITLNVYGEIYIRKNNNKDYILGYFVKTGDGIYELDYTVAAGEPYQGYVYFKPIIYGNIYKLENHNSSSNSLNANETGKLISCNDSAASLIGPVVEGKTYKITINTNEMTFTYVEVE